MELSAETIEKLNEIISELHLERPNRTPCYGDPDADIMCAWFDTEAEAQSYLGKAWGGTPC